MSDKNTLVAEWLTSIREDDDFSQEALTDIVTEAVAAGYSIEEAASLLAAEVVAAGSESAINQLAEWLPTLEIPGVAGVVVRTFDDVLIHALREFGKWAANQFRPSAERRERRALRRADKMAGYAPKEAEDVRALIAWVNTTTEPDDVRAKLMGAVANLARLNKQERKAAKGRNRE